MTESDGPGEQSSSAKGYTPREVRHALWYTVVAWVFGAPFFSITSGAAFTSFLTKYLHASDLVYGIIMAAAPAAMVFLFLGSFVAERTGQVKRNFLLYTSLHRLLWLVVAAVPLWMTDLPNGVRLAIVGITVFVAQAAANYGGAGWSTWIAGIVPNSVAGKYFGFRAQMGMLSMAVVSTSVVYLLQQHGTVAGIYAVVFSVAAILGVTDILLFLPVREVPRTPEEKPLTVREILVTPWRNSLFRGFALYTMVSWIAYMMLGPFSWRFCFDPVSANGLGMSVMQAHLLLVIVPVACMAWSSPIWGQAIDRFGPKPVLAVSALCAIVFPSVWVFAHHGMEALLWLAIALGGLAWPGIEQVNFYMVAKGFPDARRTTYNASFQFVLGTATVVGTALGGACAAFWAKYIHLIPGLPDWVSHYQPVFLTALLLRVLAFVLFFPRLRLEGNAGYGQVARAIVSELPPALPGGAKVGRRRRPKGKDAPAE